MVPAALFYDDTLQPAAKDVGLIQWSGLPNPRIPILFRGCETHEDWIEEVSRSCSTTLQLSSGGPTSHSLAFRIIFNCISSFFKR
jgi:hypothetical protein